jgi:hypothetical protein
MMPELHIPLEDEPCPVADQMLGEENPFSRLFRDASIRLKPCTDPQ